MSSGKIPDPKVVLEKIYYACIGASALAEAKGLKEDNPEYNKLQTALIAKLVTELQNAKAGYMANINLPLYCKAFPNMMKAIIETVEQSNLWKNWVETPLGTPTSASLMECIHHVGYIQGDGWIEGGRPRIGVTIGKHATLHQLLLTRGFRRTNDGNAVSIKLFDLVKNNIYAMSAFDMAADLKRMQFAILGMTSTSSHEMQIAAFTRGQTPRSTISRKVKKSLINKLNKEHGVGVPKGVFVSQMTNLANFERRQLNMEGDEKKSSIVPVSVAFLVALAGFWGADGSVGFGKCGGSMQLYQANKEYLLAIADMLEKIIPDFGRPRLDSNNRGSGNSKVCHTMIFNTKQSEKLLLLVGAFDLNRQLQYLVTLVLRLVVNNRNEITSYDKTRQFLKNLLKKIRWYYPSDKKDWAVPDPVQDPITIANGIAAMNAAMAAP